MKMQITLAIAMLLAPCNATHLKQKAALKVAFPAFPVAGADLANVAVNALEGGKRELSRAMYDSSEECWGGKNPGEKQECYTYERGLRRDLSRLNEDIVGGMRELKIDFSKNTYDAKFITDLIEAEYADFVKLNSDKGRLANQIDGTLKGIQTKLTSMGLAQTAEPQDCRAIQRAMWDNQKGCEGPGECPGECCWDPQGEEQRKAQDQFWNDKRAAEDKVMIDCYLTFPGVAEINKAMPPAEEMAVILHKVIDGVAANIAGPTGLVDIQKFITELNQALTNQATRLGMSPIPEFPNPEDTAAKIQTAVAAAAALSKTEDGKRELAREVGKFRYDVLQETHNLERDISRMVPKESPKAMVSALRKNTDDIVKGAVGGLKQVGIATKQEDMSEFVNGVVDALEKVSAPGPAQKAVIDAEHKIQDEVVKEVKHDLSKIKY